MIAAGVLPRLQGEPAQGSRFAIRAIRPGEHPTQRLAEALGCEATSLERGIGRLLAQERRERMLIFLDQPALGAGETEARTSRVMRASQPRSGIAVALAGRADAALHELTPPEQRIAQ